MISRRALIAAGAAGAAALARPWPLAAQAPKRGGTLSLRTWDPPHFDQSTVHAYKTHVVISFTHSLLLRYKAGPAVAPGSLRPRGRPGRVLDSRPATRRTCSRCARACASTTSPR